MSERFKIQAPRGEEFNKLTPTEQQGIFDLEKHALNGDVARQQAKLILAAFLGLKFSQIEAFGNTEQDVETNERKLEDMLTRLGMQFIKKRVYYDANSREVSVHRFWKEGYRTFYFIGKEAIPNLAEKYLVPPTDTPADMPTYDREFGALLGMPATAIEGWIEARDSKRNQFPPLVPNSVRYGKEVDRFRWFKPSEKHWKEETKPVAEFARKVKSLSLSLYQKIMAGSPV